MFEAIIRSDEDFEKISRLFSAEDKVLKRSRYSIVKSKEGFASFEINADDVAALRATLNSITQILSVYKKMEDIVEDE